MLPEIVANYISERMKKIIGICEYPR